MPFTDAESRHLLEHWDVIRKAAACIITMHTMLVQAWTVYSTLLKAIVDTNTTVQRD